MTINSAIDAARRERAVTSRRVRWACAVFGAVVAGGVATMWAAMVRMPGQSHVGPFEPLTTEERELEKQLRVDVEALTSIGERSVKRPEGLTRAGEVLEQSFVEAGYPVQRQRFSVGGVPCDNLEVEITGGVRREEIVVVGAHYDSVQGTVGADDNASGAAAVLALARGFAGQRPARTVRFVEFVNEEPPHFQTAEMGSVVYARRSRERGERIVAMLSLETIGYYSDAPKSQHYPWPLGLAYPRTGDFVAFAGNSASADLVRQVVRSFRGSTRFPSEGIAAPAGLPGIGWSDQWAFWQEGYPGVMVTDTALFRNPGYHTAGDTADRLMYAPMARVVRGLTRVVAELLTP